MVKIKIKNTYRSNNMLNRWNIRIWFNFNWNFKQTKQHDINGRYCTFYFNWNHKQTRIQSFVNLDVYFSIEVHKKKYDYIFSFISYVAYLLAFVFAFFLNVDGFMGQQAFFPPLQVDELECMTNLHAYFYSQPIHLNPFIFLRYDYHK